MKTRSLSLMLTLAVCLVLFAGCGKKEPPVIEEEPPVTEPVTEPSAEPPAEPSAGPSAEPSAGQVTFLDGTGVAASGKDAVLEHGGVRVKFGSGASGDVLLYENRDNIEGPNESGVGKIYNLDMTALPSDSVELSVSASAPSAEQAYQLYAGIPVEDENGEAFVFWEPLQTEYRDGRAVATFSPGGMDDLPDAVSASGRDVVKTVKNAVDYTVFLPLTAAEKLVDVGNHVNRGISQVFCAMTIGYEFSSEHFLLHVPGGFYFVDGQKGAEQRFARPDKEALLADLETILGYYRKQYPEAVGRRTS